jgi:hypothetical protein
MKKALIAAAVAGAFVAPTAMAAEGPSVNIYYPMAINIGDSDSTTNRSTTDNETVIDGGGSRLMFTWTDQLNNGMSLTAYASFGNLGHTSTGAVQTRNSNLSLSGEFGSVAMGANEHFFEIDSIIDGYGADWSAGGSPLYYQLIGRSGSTAAGTAAGQGAFSFARRDTNTVWWNSKDFNGVTLRAAYIFGPGATAGSAADPYGTQLGVTYTSGAFSIKAAQATYHDYDSSGTGVATNTPSGANTVTAAGGPVAGSKATATQFVASYDFGAFSVAGLMIDMEQTNAGVQNRAGQAVTRLSVGGYGVNITMPVAGGRVIFNMAELQDQDETVAGVTGAVVDSGKSGFDIGYQHDFSANTYGFVRYDSTEQGVNFDNGGADSESDNIMLGLVFSY